MPQLALSTRGNIARRSGALGGRSFGDCRYRAMPNSNFCFSSNRWADHRSGFWIWLLASARRSVRTVGIWILAAGGIVPVMALARDGTKDSKQRVACQAHWHDDDMSTLHDQGLIAQYWPRCCVFHTSHSPTIPSDTNRIPHVRSGG